MGWICPITPCKQSSASHPGQLCSLFPGNSVGRARVPRPMAQDLPRSGQRWGLAAFCKEFPSTDPGLFFRRRFAVCEHGEFEVCPDSPAAHSCPSSLRGFALQHFPAGGLQLPRDPEAEPVCMPGWHGEPANSQPETLRRT